MLTLPIYLNSRFVNKPIESAFGESSRSVYSTELK